MAAPSDTMNRMMRGRRREMADLPAYEGPPPSDETETKEETPTKNFTVAAPGEPSTGESFEYEPMDDIPGAWVVYPPGVPCDDTEYRITMEKPAAAGDFMGMQKALEDAGATNPEPETSVVSELDSEEDGY